MNLKKIVLILIILFSIYNVQAERREIKCQNDWRKSGEYPVPNGKINCSGKADAETNNLNRYCEIFEEVLLDDEGNEIEQEEKIIEYTRTCTEIIICTEGEYKSAMNNGSWQCVDCPKGFTSRENAKSIYECYAELKPGQYIAPNKTVALCPKGTYSNVSETINYGGYGTSKCIPCQKGTFSNEEGSFNCNICAYGTTTNRTGSTSASECKKIEEPKEEVEQKEIIVDTNVCENFKFLINIVEYLLMLFRWIIPISLIILVTYDVSKAMIMVDEEKKKSWMIKASKRFLYAVLIFLIPVLAKFLFKTIDKYVSSKNDNNATSWIKCINLTLDK